MKKVLSIGVLIWLSFSLSAAYLTNIPKQITQPDGTKIACFVSGDEYYSYLHDANGYTIVLGDDGYYYYGKAKNGIVEPSSYKVGVVNPQRTNLKPMAKISEKNYAAQRAFFSSSPSSFQNAKASAFDSINNICIYITFSDSKEFDEVDCILYDSVYNSKGESLSDYYNEISFGQLKVYTYTLPKYVTPTVLSYRDIYPIAYYKPYNKTSNPTGYQGNGERQSRELSLLQRSVKWADEHSPVPASINLDNNKDGLVDNVSFIIRENWTDWSDLLWAHRSTLPANYSASLNGKRVSTYIFMPQNQADRKTISHEFFHALGAPDLYHYGGAFSSLSPAANWDIMDAGFGSMSTYMKERYGEWLSIPTVKSSGYFSIKSTLSGTEGIAYRFPIEGYESIVVEYRQNKGPYDKYLPGQGLLVYRVNSEHKGNAQYDGLLDELYVFRPDGSITNNGDANHANLSNLVGRTTISDSTNPALYRVKAGQKLKALPTGLEIYNIEEQGDSCITFNLYRGSNFDPENIYIFPNVDDITMGWKNNKDADSILVIRSEKALRKSVIPFDGISYNVGDSIDHKALVVYKSTGSEFKDTKVDAGKTYYYTVFSKNTNTKYSRGVEISATVIAQTVSCEKISNIGAGDTLRIYEAPNWGSLSGHSSKRISMYAEKFTRNMTPGMINAININFSACHAANANSTFTLWLASEDNKGMMGEKFYWQEVKINTLKEGENRIELSTPVLAKENFYVGYTISANSSGDTIAVRMASSHENRINTAYLYFNRYVGWSSMLEVYGLSTSLAIEPVICNGVGEQGTYFEVFPANLMLEEKGTAVNVGVWSNLGLWTVSNLPKWASASTDYSQGILNITATENNLLPERTATVTIGVAGKNKTITLTQKGPANIEDNTGIANIQVYPNPSATGIFELRTPSVCQYQIIDYTGKILVTGNTSTSHTRLDISQYSSGMYFIKVVDGQKQSVLKLIK
ncbi:MAG: T9SS type A sorting domain-containing protein [Bacteroidales bacterium]